MISTEQLEQLLAELEQTAEQVFQQNETGKAVNLWMYGDRLKQWQSHERRGHPPVSATELQKHGLTIPSGWVEQEPIPFNLDTLQSFPDLSSNAFQHPLDMQAVQAIQAIPILPQLLAKFSGIVWERRMWLAQISTAVRLGPNQGARIYNKFVKAAEILDIPELPDIYISNRYEVNAYAFGIDRYQITLLSGLIDSLTEPELMSVIAHELGHVKCQHMLYKTMVFVIRILGFEFINRMLPLGTGLLAVMSLFMAILHWERMAEFSCDRASLLVVQDPEIVASSLTKLAGGSRLVSSEITIDGILQQAKEYEEVDVGDNLLEKIFKLQMMLQQTHPFPIVRVKRIMEWAESDEYRHIMQGDYAKASASPHINATGKQMNDGRLVCARCQTMVFEDWKHCPTCGTEL